MSLSNTATGDVDAPGASRPRPRIALYSHDTQGLGHIRRNLLLASVFQRMGCQPVILLLSGVREAGAFRIPPTVDCLTLPALGKDQNGKYRARSLDMPTDELSSLRRSTLGATLSSFDPDVLIVDKVPLGALGELETALAALRARGRTRCVLGLREILDDPATVAREWHEGAYNRAIDAYYDRVWVYGDPRVFNPAHAYAFSLPVCAKLRYSGYLNPGDAAGHEMICDGEPVSRIELPPGRVMLCEVGGGSDGVKLAHAFAHARLPADSVGVLVTGPQMPAEARESLRRLATGRGNLRVFEFVTDCSPLLERADRVVAMAGYNTVCEIVGQGKPSLLVPRVQPRTEQLIRAMRFAELGLVRMLHPDDLSAEAISAFLMEQSPPRPDRDRVDLNGVARLPELLNEVLSLGHRAKELCRAAI